MEIGQVYALANQLASVVSARYGRAQAVAAQAVATESAGMALEPRLPSEDALRAIATGVAEYIATNKLMSDEGYQAFKAEFVSDIPRALLTLNEMKLVEKLSEQLLAQTQVVMNQLTNETEPQVSPAFKLQPEIAAAQPDGKNLGEADEVSVARNSGDVIAIEMPAQISGRISLAFIKAPLLIETGRRSTDAGPDEIPAPPMEEVPAGTEEGAASWSIHNSVLLSGDERITPTIISTPLNLAVKLPGEPIVVTGPVVRASSVAESSSVAPVAQTFSGAQQQQADSDVPFTLSSEGPGHPLLRADLKMLLGGKTGELRIHYDEALIVSKVAVLVEQMNGLARIYEEQGRSVSAGRKEPISDDSPLVRQVLASALGIVMDSNKVFRNPASIGISATHDGLLALDPTLLKTALASHKEETVTILKSITGSLYDNIGLYVDPRILARFSELLQSGVPDKADRSRKEEERRWQKDKDLLDKKYMELELLLEESGKLRDWFMSVVTTLGSGTTESDPADHVAKRPLPAVDLTWDEDDAPVVDRPGEPGEHLVEQFVASTSLALQEEDAAASIKLLLRRKSLSDKLIVEKPPLEPKTAMVCLANEELVMEKIEIERQNLFKELDRLARTTAAARGYQSRFPLPPPMAAFVSSEG
ncbi:MAG TPA: hypothetical protein VMT71_12595 [Syntrophorhabdales bacterium]|nr:hypothetical protein [Syntrophorhabdales bacterium]